MAIALGLAMAPAAAGTATAAPTSLCVACSNPAQTYVCQVDSPFAKGSQALQLFCVVKIAKEGGHSSCAVSKDVPEGQCNGPVKTYAYDGPPIPSELRAHVGGRAAPPAEQPAQKDGPPETLVQVGKGAGGAVRDAAGSASRVVRDAAGGAGDKVGGAAKGAGHAAKSAGSKIGDAARSAYDCVVSLFKGCGSRAE